MERDRSNG